MLVALRENLFGWDVKIAILCLRFKSVPDNMLTCLFSVFICVLTSNAC